MVHDVPEQENAGNIVLAPIALPCVLENAAISDTRNVLVVPWNSVMPVME